MCYNVRVTMQSIPAFLIYQKLLISGKKMLKSAELMRCVPSSIISEYVWQILVRRDPFVPLKFMSSLKKAYPEYDWTSFVVPALFHPKVSSVSSPRIGHPEYYYISSAVPSLFQSKGNVNDNNNRNRL